MPLFARSQGRRTGAAPPFLAANVLVWLSAVIVLGIVAYWFSRDPQPSPIVFILVTSILTVLAVPAAFLLGAYLHYVLLLNLVLSFLWLAVVVFAAWWFSGAGSAQAHAVEAFSFLAFFGLLFNILYSWWLGFSVEDAPAPRVTSTV